MRLSSISLLLSFILLSFVSGCSEKESLTDVQVKTNMITRSWMGEEYFIIAVGDSSFKGRDFVETFDFRKDGSYFYYKYTMSSFGWIGKWNLEDNGNHLRLVRDSTYSEAFPITYLSSTSFILGDTNSRGYKLVLKNN